MNTINVIIELGPESMAKLDKILEALQGLPHGCTCHTENTVVLTAEPASQPEPEPEEPPAPLNPDVIMPAPAEQPEPAAAPEPEAPKYTKADVLALVQKLAAPTSPEAKRTGAKAIVKEYGAKVSDIPEAKYGEVMDKLTALDKEG
jgi:hypothetical protein